VKVRGLQAIDRRTSAARALLGWRKDLLDDLGGAAATKGKMRRSALFGPAVSAQTLAKVPHFGTAK
jgi:hypothetical protein